MEDTNKTTGLPNDDLISYARELTSMHQLQYERMTELQQLYEDLQTKERQRAMLLSQLITAQEQERKRISSDIHDGPLQELGAELLAIDRCARMLQNGKLTDAVEELHTLRSWLRATVSNLRNVITDLRPPLLDTTGLLKALDNLFARFKRDTGVEIDFESAIGGRLHPTLETLCYRIVQEALANVRQHARAESVLIQMRRVEKTLELIIRDDGRGFDVREAMERSLATGHIGLTSLTERAQVAGGSLEILSAPGRGTTLYFRMPFVGVTGPEAGGDGDRYSGPGADY